MRKYPKELFKLQSEFVETMYPLLRITRQRAYFQLTNFYVRIIGFDYAKFPSEHNKEWIKLISKCPENNN